MDEVTSVKTSKLKEQQKLEAVEKRINETKKDVPVINNKVNNQLWDYPSIEISDRKIL